MPDLIRTRKRVPLPADAEVRAKGGKRFARVPVRGRVADCEVTACGGFYLQPDKNYAADMTGADGKRFRVRLASTEAASRAMLDKLVKGIEMERAGFKPDPLAAQAKRPLTEHLADWRASLAASGRPDDYLDRKLNRTAKAFAACRFARLADLDAAALESHLYATRKAGKSVQTANDDLQACRQFARWMLANDRLAGDPFARLKGQNPELDRRRVRGELDPSERSALVAAALASPNPFRGLAGTDRAMIYRVAMATGFRAGELAKLTPASFDLTPGNPAATLPASATKNGKPARQPLPPALAGDLAHYLAGKPAGSPGRHNRASGACGGWRTTSPASPPARQSGRGPGPRGRPTCSPPTSPRRASPSPSPTPTGA